MNLSNREEILKRVLDKIKLDDITYKQYLHRKVCKTGPCDDLDVSGKRSESPKDTCCAPFIGHIHADNQLHRLPKHPNCDCYYQNVPTRTLGSISKKQPAPDLWIKQYGFDSLPDYYITKKEATVKYGWKKGKNLSKLAPGKMIGGDIYFNRKRILPEKEGRIWKHCDIDYTDGKRRNSLRLYYSSDGLMFYSTNHLNEKELPIVYWIK